MTVIMRCTHDAIVRQRGILISKVENIEQHPFFKDKSVAKMTMEIWSRLDFDEFHNYILEHLDSKTHISSFLRSFTNLWNGTINGMFKKDDYNFITDTLRLDCNLLLEKMKEVLPELNTFKHPEELFAKWKDHDYNSEDQNIEQFMYWHLISAKSNDNKGDTFTKTS